MTPGVTTAYTVTITDDFVSSNGTTCTSPAGGATVTVNPALSVVVDDETICEGETVTFNRYSFGR